MGYYTNYSLSIKKGNNDLISEFVRENSGYVLNINGKSLGECRWYGHERDLKEFSTRHPKAVFELKGVGGDNLDIWIKYFQNGKCQNCEARITFDDFDKTKLK
jgi:hypothetical protein